MILKHRLKQISHTDLTFPLQTKNHQQILLIVHIVVKHFDIGKNVNKDEKLDK